MLKYLKITLYTLILLAFSKGIVFAGYDDFFIKPHDLKKIINNKNVVIVDAREGDDYKNGHIKGAVSIKWKQISNMKPDFSSKGWGTVTDKKILLKAITNSGIDEKSMIIVYGDTINGWGEEGRIYWSLKIAGLKNIKILDGGIKGWIKSGGKIYEKGNYRKSIKKSSYTTDELILADAIDTDTLLKNYSKYKIIDTRTKKEYDGAKKFGEKRGGHLPGAVLIPYKSLLKNGYLKKESEIKSFLRTKGIKKEDKLVTYCTAGIRSAYVQVVLKMLGYNVINYDESFYVWAKDKNTKLGIVDGDNNYNYITKEQLKKEISLKKDIILIDIQKEDKIHYQNAVKTGAYPVKSSDDLQKLEKALSLIKKSEREVVIINPDDEESSVRAFNYFVKKGVNPSRIYVLGKGKSNWWFF